MKKDYLDRDSLRKTRKLKHQKIFLTFVRIFKKCQIFPYQSLWKSSIENAKYVKYLYE